LWFIDYCSVYLEQKMTQKMTTYDPAAALVDDEEIAFFMADAFETGDVAYIAKALGIDMTAKPHAGN